MDDSGRIAVPKAMRDRLQPVAGQDLEPEEHGGVIEIRPVPAEIEIVTTAEGLVARMRSGNAGLDDEMVRNTLESIR